MRRWLLLLPLVVLVDCRCSCSGDEPTAEEELLQLEIDNLVLKPTDRVELILETEDGPEVDGDGEIVPNATLMLTSSPLAARPRLLGIEHSGQATFLRLQ